jgi:hypothetical protein
MEHESDVVLDGLLNRASESALTSLDLVVDVEQRLHDLLRELGQRKEPDDNPM